MLFIDIFIFYRYGEDGLDGMWVENQTMLSMKPTNALFEKEFRLDLSDEKSAVVNHIHIKCIINEFHLFIYLLSHL